MCMYPKHNFKNCEAKTVRTERKFDNPQFNTFPSPITMTSKQKISKDIELNDIINQWI